MKNENSNNLGANVIIKDQFHVLEDFSTAEFYNYAPESFSLYDAGSGKADVVMQVLLRHLRPFKKHTHGETVEPVYMIRKIPIFDNMMHGRFTDGFAVYDAEPLIKQQVLAQKGCWELVIILVGAIGALCFIGAAIDSRITLTQFPWRGDWLNVWLAIIWMGGFTLTLILLYRHWNRVLRNISPTVSDELSAETVLNYGNLFPVLAYNGKYDGFVPIFGAGISPIVDRNMMTLRFSELNMRTEDVFGHGSRNLFLKHLCGLSPIVCWALSYITNDFDTRQPEKTQAYTSPETSGWRTHRQSEESGISIDKGHAEGACLVLKRTVPVERDDGVRGISHGFMVLEIPARALSGNNPESLISEGIMGISDTETLKVLSDLEQEGWIEADNFTFQEWNLTESMRKKIREWHKDPDTKPFELLQFNGKTHLDSPFDYYESILDKFDIDIPPSNGQ